MVLYYEKSYFYELRVILMYTETWTLSIFSSLLVQSI